MIDAKHTPGPWLVPVQTYSRFLTVETSDGVDGTDGLVACPGSGGSMSYTKTVCTLGWQGTPEWEANARLIAAAPDLLASLEEACDPLSGYLYGPALDRARAAIARAKGRE